MKRNVLLALLLFVNIITALSQSKYCQRYQRNRPVNFYRGWHDKDDYKVPAGVSKETVYHQKINSKDSILEKVTRYT